MKKYLAVFISLLIALSAPGCLRSQTEDSETSASQEDGGLFNTLSGLFTSVYENLPAPAEDSPAPDVLRYHNGSLYQAGAADAASYMNPSFDLYYAPPEDLLLIDSEFFDVFYDAGLPDIFLIELAGSSEDGESAFAIISAEVPAQTTVRQWMLQNFAVLFSDRDEAAFQSVDIAGQTFTRYEPGLHDPATYFTTIRDGIALSLVITSADEFPGREESWLAGFSSLSAPASKTEYQKGILNTDGYESLYLEERFSLPLFMDWYFSEDIADSDSFSCEFEAMSLNEDFYAAFYTEVPAFEEERTQDYLGFLMADIVSRYPGDWSGEFEDVQIAGREYLMAEYSENIDGYLSITRYYTRRQHGRFVLLMLNYWAGDEENVQIFLDGFSPWTADLSPAACSYYEGTVQNGLYENHWADLAFEQTENSLAFPAAEVSSLYLPGRELEGITEFSDCMTLPEFSCLILPEEDPYWISHASLLIYAEELPASSTLVQDYIRLLPGRASEPDSNVRYTFENYTGCALIGGRLYTTLLSSSRSYNDPVYRKYFLREEDGRILCLVATYNAGHAPYVQSVLNRLYSPE